MFQKGRSAALGFIFITVLIDVIGFGIIIPVLPNLIQDLTGGDMSEASRYGGWLMFLYTLGLAIPFVVMAALSTLVLKYFVRLEKHLEWIKKVGGFLIVIMGVLLMTRNLTTVSIWIEKLF